MIFNKLSNGAAEAKAILGFIYKSNKFENLFSYIAIAERHIKRVIGTEVFALAENHYNSDDYKAESPTEQMILLDELVEKIQLPLLIHAYRKYAPLNDVSHNEAGRQIEVTENLKPAFEWQIERDNRSLIDIENETTDILLEFLDEQPEDITEEVEGGHGAPVDIVENTIYKAWFTSTTYSATKGHFINSSREFDRIYPINESRRLFLVLIPFMAEVERNVIAPVISQEKYDTIIELIRDKDLDVVEHAEEKLIYEKALAPIALLTIATALKRLSVELLPNSVVQSFDALDVKQTKTADTTTRTGVSVILREEANLQLSILTSYVQSLLPLADQYVEETSFDSTKPFTIF